MAGPVRGGSDYLDLGDWNATCSMCGNKRKASYLVKNWQGQWRCPEHNEPRHPQEYVRAVPDIQTPPWTQPGADVFTEFCSPLGMTGIADVGIADCAICDYVSPILGPYDLPILARVYLTSGSTWTVPANWTNIANTVECIGWGGDAGPATDCGGGGGGAYSLVSNLSLSGTVQYHVGTNGTWFNGTALNTASVSAAAGTSGGFLLAGIGGAAASGIGETKYSGGNGGSANTGLGGGGGSAGPLGNGSAGATAPGDASHGGVGGAGNNGTVIGGTGGVGGSGSSGASDASWDSYHGVGSGGGGGGASGLTQFLGGNGGTYGGGAGGSGFFTAGSKGGQGLIIISYLIPDPVVDNSGVPVTFPVTVPIQINQTSVPPGRVGVPYSFRFTAIGGSGSYSWTATVGSPQPLPDGLTLDSTTGIITGTPTASVSTHSLVRLTDTVTGLFTNQAISFFVAP